MPPTRKKSQQLMPNILFRCEGKTNWISVSLIKLQKDY